MWNEFIEQVRQINTIEEVIKDYGIVLKDMGSITMTLCQFHSDRDPSLAIYKETQSFYCFGCGKGGDVFNFVMLKENMNFLEALYYLAKKKGIERPEFNKEQKRKYIQMQQIKDLKGKLLDTLVDIFQNNDKSIVWKYLKKRGIKEVIIEKYKIGYSNYSLEEIKNKLIEKGFSKIQLNISQFFKDNRFYENSLIIPIRQNGKIITLLNRTLNKRQPKYLYLSNLSRGIFNLDEASCYKEIIITESVIDALTLIGNGFINIIALNGCKASDNQIEDLKKLKDKQYYICFDNDLDKEDNPGFKSALELSKILKNSRIVILPTKQNKIDINDYFLQGNTIEDFKNLLKNATRLAYYEPYLEEIDEYKMIYRVNEFDYYIENINKTENGIKALITLYFKNNIIQKNPVSLYSSRSRVEFSNQCGKHNPKEIEKHLLNIEIKIKEILNQKEELNKVKKKEMTEEERQEALEFLKSSKIFEIIKEDISTLGYVGEDTNKLMVYLIATSRKLENPLSVIIKAQSASGKSELLKKIMELMPEEDVKDLSRITENALFWVDQDSLKHKFIVIMEKDGSEQADYPIRILQSEKKLTLLAPQKDDIDGKIKTQEFEIEGPVAFAETTCETSDNFENNTRVFDLYVNESEEQTKLIHEVQKEERTLEGLVKKISRDKIIRKHQNAQKLLKTIKVIIPYAKFIEFPYKLVRTRRDMSRFLDLITVITFLRQYQKEIKKDNSIGEFIEADMGDYKTAHEIALDVLGQTLDELDRRSRYLLNEIIDMVETIKEEKELESINEVTFTRKDILNWLDKKEVKWYPQILQTYIKPLEEGEYLEIISGGKGKISVYRLVVPDNRENDILKYPLLLKGLLTPKELEQKINIGK